MCNFTFKCMYIPFKPQIGYNITYNVTRWNVIVAENYKEILGNAISGVWTKNKVRLYRGGFPGKKWSIEYAGWGDETNLPLFPNWSPRNPETNYKGEGREFENGESKRPVEERETRVRIKLVFDSVSVESNIHFSRSVALTGKLPWTIGKLMWSSFK